MKSSRTTTPPGSTRSATASAPLSSGSWASRNNSENGPLSRSVDQSAASTSTRSSPPAWRAAGPSRCGRRRRTRCVESRRTLVVRRPGGQGERSPSESGRRSSRSQWARSGLTPWKVPRIRAHLECSEARVAGPCGRSSYLSGAAARPLSKATSPRWSSVRALSRSYAEPPQRVKHRIPVASEHSSSSTRATRVRG